MLPTRFPVVVVEPESIAQSLGPALVHVQDQDQVQEEVPPWISEAAIAQYFPTRSLKKDVAERHTHGLASAIIQQREDDRWLGPKVYWAGLRLALRIHGVESLRGHLFFCVASVVPLMRIRLRSRVWRTMLEAQPSEDFVP